MAESPDDLWPEEVFKGIGVVAPLQILREQANALTKRTGGALRGLVNSKAAGVNAAHDLNVNVPALNYLVTLVRVEHAVARLYPARVVIAAGATASTYAMAGTAAQLRSVLKRAFATDRITRLLGALLAQVQGE